jgi:hypothetical protein
MLCFHLSPKHFSRQLLDLSGHFKHCSDTYSPFVPIVLMSSVCNPWFRTYILLFPSSLNILCSLTDDAIYFYGSYGNHGAVDGVFRW